jgi:hypothetical protein
MVTPTAHPQHHIHMHARGRSTCNDIDLSYFPNFVCYVLYISSSCNPTNFPNNLTTQQHKIEQSDWEEKESHATNNPPYITHMQMQTCKCHIPTSHPTVYTPYPQATRYLLPAVLFLDRSPFGLAFHKTRLLVKLLTICTPSPSRPPTFKMTLSSTGGGPPDSVRRLICFSLAARLETIAFANS